MLINSSLIKINKENFHDKQSNILSFIVKKKDGFYNVNNNQINGLNIARKNYYIKNSDIYAIKNIFEESKNANDSQESLNTETFYYLDNKKNNNEIKEVKNDKKCLGRKKKRNRTEESKHNKFSDDNIRRKCKHIMLNNLMDFINYKISEKYEDIGQGIFLKKLLMLNHEQKSNANIDYDQKFLNKKIGEIFAENISSRYTSFPKEHNKNLINKLINEKDDNKRMYFNTLFNLTFIECLKHFRGSDTINELDGLKGYKEAINEYEKEGDIDYKTCLEYYINHFEKIINNKKSRQKKLTKIKEE